ncbi:MAG: ribonuclease P protein component [Eubacteriales bacterium]|nr:ribonuclease P protein component [Eubacteriales bacterium]
MRILKKHYDFNRVFRRGQHSRAASVAIHYFKRRDHDPSRVGVTATKSAKTAVARNRSKRLLRAAYMAIEEEILPSYDLVLILLSDPSSSSAQRVSADLRRAAQRANLLIEGET